MQYLPAKFAESVCTSFPAGGGAVSAAFFIAAAFLYNSSLALSTNANCFIIDIWNLNIPN
jgi:hypothetical protein